MTAPVRVVVGEDDVLLREGICRLLEEADFEVVAQAGDADDLLRKTLAHKPDVAVVDIQMPPDRTDDGLRAALELRKRLPGAGILVLSHLAEGKSNQGIAEALVVTPAAVEKHVTSIFHKLRINASPTGHRRVLAALAYLRGSRP